jgi:hypothetical protein
MKVIVFELFVIYQENTGLIIKNITHFIRKFRVHGSYFTAFGIMIFQHCTKHAHCWKVKYYERQKNKHTIMAVFTIAWGNNAEQTVSMKAQAKYLHPPEFLFSL